MGQRESKIDGEDYDYDDDDDDDNAPDAGIPDLTEEMVYSVSTLSKMFVRDLVREGRKSMKEHGEEGNIQPRHLRSAYRSLENRGYFHIRERGSTKVSSISGTRDRILLIGRPRTRSSKG